MKRHLGWTIASVISLAGVGGASAADMALKAPPPPVVPVYSWTGCYVGGNIGGKSARTTDRVNIGPGAGAAGPTAPSFLDFGSADSGTVIGGGQVGCNWQNGHLVVGIEGDIDAQNWKRTDVVGPLLVPPLFVVGDTFQLKSTWEASIRGRIGYAWDRVLLYATGGVAFTDVQATSNWLSTTVGVNPPIVFPGTLASQTKNLVGATVGAGLEYGVTNNFTVGVEGRYTWYGSQTFGAGLLATAATPPVAVAVVAPGFSFAPTTRDVSVQTGEVMFKANWKFWPGGPVVAKY